MNLRQVEVFRAVMLSGSITRAASMLRVSQPAVSQVLRSTESQLKLKLFERVRGRLQPTEEAHALFGEAQHLHSALERIERMADGLRRRQEQIVELLISPSLALSLLPGALLAFRQRWPNVQISCEPLGYRSIIARLKEHQADLGLAMGPTEEEGLDSVRIGRVPLVCAVPERHVLAQASKIRPEDLSGENIISYQGESAVGREVQSAFSEAGIAMNSSILVPFGSTALDLVPVGLGVAIVDKLTAFASTRAGLVIRPFTPARTLDVAVIYSAERRPTQPLLDLITVLRSESRTRIGWKCDVGV